MPEEFRGEMPTEELPQVPEVTAPEDEGDSTPPQAPETPPQPQPFPPAPAPPAESFPAVPNP